VSKEKPLNGIPSLMAIFPVRASFLEKTRNTIVIKTI
jgi:hypothetical protein